MITFFSLPQTFFYQRLFLDNITFYWLQGRNDITTDNLHKRSYLYFRKPHSVKLCCKNAYSTIKNNKNYSLFQIWRKKFMEFSPSSNQCSVFPLIMLNNWDKADFYFIFIHSFNTFMLRLKALQLCFWHSRRKAIQLRWHFLPFFDSEVQTVLPWEGLKKPTAKVSSHTETHSHSWEPI